MTVPPTIPESQVGPERQSPSSSCVKLPRACSSGHWAGGCRLVVVVLAPVAAYSGGTGICKVGADS